MLISEDIFNTVANKVYSNKLFEKECFVDHRGDTMLWLCEDANQQKLIDMGIECNVDAICRFIYQCIRWRYLKYYNKHIKNKSWTSIDSDDIDNLDGILPDYTVDIDSQLAKDSCKDEITYMLDNLDADDVELLVALCVGDDNYGKIAEDFGVNYDCMKQRIYRLKKKCKKLFRDFQPPVM